MTNSSLNEDNILRSRYERLNRIVPWLIMMTPVFPMVAFFKEPLIIKVNKLLTKKQALKILEYENSSTQKMLR